MARGDDHRTETSRLAWERRWGSHDASELQFHIEDVPEQLRALLDSGTVPEGPAVDLGCGASVVTPFLAQTFQPTVGVDFSHAALKQARERAAAASATTFHAVGDARALPLRSSTFALVFDRGCLQNLPRPDWERYFREVERVLVPGGILDLYCSKQAKGFPPLASRAGVRARLRWYSGRRRGPQFLSHELLESLASPNLAVATLEDFQYTTAAGMQRLVTHGVFRRVGGAT